MKVEVTVEGVPNELYAQNMEYRHQYDEIVKHFAEGQLKEAGAIQKDLQLHNVNIASYYTDKYALLLDFRTIDDNRIHGSGRRLENTSEGIRLQITKKAESDKNVFIVCDLQGKLNEWIKLFKNALTLSGPGGLRGLDGQTHSCQSETSYPMMPKLGDF